LSITSFLSGSFPEQFQLIKEPAIARARYGGRLLPTPLNAD
jgi:hypothetical protein